MELPSVLVDIVVDYLSIFDRIGHGLELSSEYLVEIVRATLGDFIDEDEMERETVLGDLVCFGLTGRHQPSENELAGIIALLWLDRLHPHVASAHVFKAVSDLSVNVKSRIYPRLISVLSQNRESESESVLSRAAFAEVVLPSDKSAIHVLFAACSNLTSIISPYTRQLLASNHPQVYTMYCV